MITPLDEKELADAVVGAAGPLRIVGGGTRQTLGHPVVGDPISTEKLSGIRLYEPGALTLVAGAGTPLSEVEAALAAEGQRLSFEPMDHRGILGTTGEPTIGGVVACNASGPRRIQAGACRDSVIGARFVDGHGNIIKNGGRVMKNVTGYDLVKLMAGSYGTLGVLSEVSLKVLPQSETATVIVHGAEGLNALAAMTKAMRSPYDVTGAAHVPGDAAKVMCRVEGFTASIDYRTGKLRDLLKDFGEVTIDGDQASQHAIWTGLRDVTDFHDDSYAVWRVSMAPSAMFSGLLAAVTQVVPVDYRLDWAGGLAWIRLSEDTARTAAGLLNAKGRDPLDGAVAFHGALQDLVKSEGGGHATLIKAPTEMRKTVPVFQPQSAALTAISAGLRQKFDPKGILNPGLMG